PGSGCETLKGRGAWAGVLGRGGMPGGRPDVVPAGTGMLGARGGTMVVVLGRGGAGGEAVLNRFENESVRMGDDGAFDSPAPAVGEARSPESGDSEGLGAA